MNKNDSKNASESDEIRFENSFNPYNCTDSVLEGLGVMPFYLFVCINLALRVEYILTV